MSGPLSTDTRVRVPSMSILASGGFTFATGGSNQPSRWDSDQTATWFSVRIRKDHSPARNHVSTVIWLEESGFVRSGSPIVSGALSFTFLRASTGKTGLKEPEMLPGNFALQVGGGIDIRRSQSIHGLRVSADYRRVFAGERGRHQFQFVASYFLGWRGQERSAPRITHSLLR